MTDLLTFQLYTMEQKVVDNKKRKTPIPQGFDRILPGALKLPLQDRVNLCRLITDSITAELKQRQAQLDEAKAIVDGSQSLKPNGLGQ